jgi:hypothetical protein
MEVVGIQCPTSEDLSEIVLEERPSELLTIEKGTGLCPPKELILEVAPEDLWGDAVSSVALIFLIRVLPREGV